MSTDARALLHVIATALPAAVLIPVAWAVVLAAVAGVVSR